MKNLLILNKTISGEPGSQEISFQLNKTAEGVLTNVGPVGAFSSNGNSDSICLAPSLPIAAAAVNETDIIDITGTVAIEVDGVVIPYIFTPEGLINFFQPGNQYNLEINPNPPVSGLSFKTIASAAETSLAINLTSDDFMDFSVDIFVDEIKTQTLISTNGILNYQQTFAASETGHVVTVVNNKNLSLAEIFDNFESVLSWGNVPCNGFIFRSSDLTAVPNFLPASVTSTNAMFFGCANFNQNISMWDTTNVTDMTAMFIGAASFNQPIGNWNTGNVTSTSAMFENAISFNQDISNWNVSNVINMSGMFRGATNFNQNISLWNTSKVTNMQGMFQNAWVFNQPLDNWNVSSVTDMSSMFLSTTSFNQPLSSWDTSKVTVMFDMFSSASGFNQDLSQWCVGLITSLPNGFNIEGNMAPEFLPIWGSCPRGENIPDSNFTKATYLQTDTSNPMWINVEYLAENSTGKLYVNWGDGVIEALNPSDFEDAGEYFISLTHAYTSNGEYTVKVYSTTKTMYIRFGEITKVIDWGDPTNLQIRLPSANLIEVPVTIHPSMIELTDMFNGASSFNQDLSQWNMSNVTSMSGMFGDATAFNQPIGIWNTSKVTNMEVMFTNATAFNQDLSQWCVGLIPALPGNFDLGSALTVEQLPVWGTCPRGENIV